ncbi:MAG: hypothetical protein M1281_16220 [Chloroflexi bacterium]|nr:hypothetical protein [Chloroflexota bacterium]
MLKHQKLLLPSLLLIFWFLGWILVSPVEAENSVVQAILFYSPSCPHCRQVIQEGLTPLLDRYGEQLEIAGIDTSTPGGSALFEAAI